LKAELVSVGTELLLGEITDTNAVYISQRLADIGVDIHFRHTVGDNLDRLVSVLREAGTRCDAVIMCGGLGPTEDDITRDGIAAVTGRPLQRDADAVAHLKDFFARRGIVPTENNLKQCDAPQGGTLLENTCGTAPGLLVEHEGVAFFAVPGPPTEMREMMDRSVLPWLRERVGAEGGGILHTRTLRVCDLGESMVASQIGDLIRDQTDPTIALYASPGEVKVRFATKDRDEAAAQARLGDLEANIRAILGIHVYGTDDENMERAVGTVLLERNATVASAESCTGGLVASRITDVPGASRYFLTGVVAYANDTKRWLLGVSQEILDTEGAVSEACARAMAEGVRGINGADFGVATTGIAGPDGGTETKPVGLVYIAVADANGTVCIEQNWPGTRDQFKQRVSQMALNLLRKRILGQV
jgi:nicotinamide-nucleotide amidase